MPGLLEQFRPRGPDDGDSRVARMLPAWQPRMLSPWPTDVEAGLREVIRDAAGRFAETAGGAFGAAKRVLGFGGTPDEPKQADVSFNDKVAMALRDLDFTRDGPQGHQIVTVDGKEWMVKDKGTSQEEALGAQLGREIGIDIAEARSVTVDGRERAVVEWFEGAASLKKLGDEEAAMALKSLPRKTIEQQALYDYVIGNNDSHNDNTLILGDRMIGIDKEHGLPKEAKTIWFEPVYVGLLDETGLNGDGFQLSRDSVETMIIKGERVAGRLDELGESQRAQSVRGRLQVMRRFAQLPDTDLKVGKLRLLSRVGGR